jgi:hypothetical protein
MPAKESTFKQKSGVGKNKNLPCTARGGSQAKMCCEKKLGRKKCEDRERRRKRIAARVGTLHWMKKIKHKEVVCHRGIKNLMMRENIFYFREKTDNASVDVSCARV